jgi:hypothetical protein
VEQLLTAFLNDNTFAARLADRMRDETGTRLIDWVDHLAMPDTAELTRELTTAGFERTEIGTAAVWRHPRGLFPSLVLHGGARRGLALLVESVADFLVAHGLDERITIHGQPMAAVRRSAVASESDAQLWVIERHGHDGWEPPDLDGDLVLAILRHREAFRHRRRDFDDSEDGFAHAERLIRDAVVDLGTNRACDLFFGAEREYWQRRNRAARLQKARQDALGLGWANHDHHTYRSSRKCFSRLIRIFHMLGCRCRERFYAGSEAGWGAQVLEQPACRIVIFADVDLSPEEISGDFAREPLRPRNQLGTVGLWCRLHGEAFLTAGMHHLECQFDFDLVRQQLRTAGVETLPPFTDFDYLKQAFTEGEMWPVASARIEAALADGHITAAQAAQFQRHGALGSHLEILQRNDGYQGFNQTGISEIIARTDPRRQIGSTL